LIDTMQPSDLELCSAVVEQAPDALIFADREGTIKLWNARAEAIFGYAAVLAAKPLRAREILPQ
jgi:PAS domain S-box-containing protein